jgi:NAD(P)H-hydrate epimerase
VRAHRTYTFGHAKRGLLTSRGAELSGPVEVVDLGVSPRLGPGGTPGAWWLEASDVAAFARPRAASAHKGQSGRVAVMAGGPGKTGAALLSATAALRAGAGLVTVCNFPEVTASLDQRVLEVMTRSLDAAQLEAELDAALADAHAVVIGPGLGLDERARRVVDRVVLGFEGPAVVDADAITHFAGRAEALREARGPRLLTPHAAELGRIVDASARDVESDRFGVVERAVERTGQHVLLKGPHTLIGSPGEPIWVSSFGSAVLATGGSGDVLSGVCGALAVAGSLREAAALAAALHGVAGRLWVERHRGADRGLLAGELAELLPAARVELSGARAS